MTSKKVHEMVGMVAKLRGAVESLRGSLQASLSTFGAHLEPGERRDIETDLEEARRVLTSTAFDVDLDADVIIMVVTPYDERSEIEGVFDDIELAHEAVAQYMRAHPKPWAQREGHPYDRAEVISWWDDGEQDYEITLERHEVRRREAKPADAGAAEEPKARS